MPCHSFRARQKLPGKFCRSGSICNQSLTIDRLAGPTAGIVREASYLAGLAWPLMQKSKTAPRPGRDRPSRAEEHASELQSLMRIACAVFLVKKKTTTKQKQNKETQNHVNTI